MSIKYKNNGTWVEAPVNVIQKSDSKFTSLLDRSITEVTAEDLKDCTIIREYAFYSCYDLERIEIPNGITEIGAGAFYLCYALKNIVIPDSVTSIGNDAFRSSYITSITLSQNITTIPQYCFTGCHNLENITIPDKVTDIKMYSFQNCSALKYVIIPPNINKIDRQTFQNCTSMEYYDFTRCTAVPTLSYTNAFSGIPSTCEIRVPSSLYDQWIAATNWSTYASNIVAV